MYSIVFTSFLWHLKLWPSEKFLEGTAGCPQGFQKMPAALGFCIVYLWCTRNRMQFYTIFSSIFTMHLLTQGTQNGNTRESILQNALFGGKIVLSKNMSKQHIKSAYRKCMFDKPTCLWISKRCLQTNRGMGGKLALQINTGMRRKRMRDHFV